jgi:predicted nucleic-acid-binding protein
VVAVDTNVVVRLLTGDDARQAARASALFRAEEIWLSKSVILETEWVLRSLYRFRGDRLCAAMLALTSLPKVRVEDPAAVSRALGWTSLGMDFADALHLASRSESANFVSFDEKLVKRAKGLGVTAVALLHV